MFVRFIFKTGAVATLAFTVLWTISAEMSLFDNALGLAQQQARAETTVPCAVAQVQREAFGWAAPSSCGAAGGAQ